MSRLSIRDAVPSDGPLYLRLFPELGLDEPLPGPARVAALIESMQIAGDGEAHGFIVAIREGHVGFVRQVAVSPSARRAGVGRALMGAAAARFRALGVRQWRLNVKDDNAPALGLYRALGMELAFRSAALWMPRGAHLRLPGDEAPIVIASPRQEELEGLEERYELSPGQLRGPSPGALVRTARRAHPSTGSLGFMRFSPSFPGAYPFFARGAPVARSLVAAAFDLAPRMAPRIGLVIERDDALVETLLAAGAELRFRMLQLRGGL